MTREKLILGIGHSLVKVRSALGGAVFYYIINYNIVNFWECQKMFQSKVILVPSRGFEPLTLAGLRPKRSAYASSATRAMSMVIASTSLVVYFRYGIERGDAQASARIYSA